ncbi:MAG: hypothetical protein KAW12_11720 [Candidatus Aminicenantes bacterium]|nr:hypothetical protein [Candidatus Aminicenantes bacterium]
MRDAELYIGFARGTTAAPVCVRVRTGKPYEGPGNSIGRYFKEQCHGDLSKLR